MEDDIDFVSDLGDDSPDTTIPASTGSVDPNRGTDVPAAPKPATEAPKTDQQQAPKPKLSLRDQISSAVKGEAETPPAAAQDGRARNPDGTFAPKAADAPIEAPGAPPAAAPVAPPAGLSPQEAQVFSQLPAELQTSVARTMEQLNERATRFAGYEQMEQVIGPRRQGFALNGMTDAQVVGQLFALSDFAAERPAEFIKYFAEQRGVDLEEIIFGAEPVDPEVSALHQRIAQLEQQQQGFTQQQQQAAHQNTVNEIIAFGTEAGQDGQPLRPYFEELGDSILPFIQAVMQQQPNLSRTQILQEAYDRACWGNPSIRAKMQEADSAARDAARIREQQDRAERARRAGASVPSGVPSGNAEEAAARKSGSLRDAIKASIASAN